MRSLGIVVCVVVLSVALFLTGAGYAESLSGDTSGTTTSDYGVKGEVTAGSGTARGVWGETSSTTNKAIGVFGRAKGRNGKVFGMKGSTRSWTTGSAGVFGLAGRNIGTVYGVYGKTRSETGRGVYGEATEVTGASYGNYGVYGKTSTNATGGGMSYWGAGVYGIAAGTTGNAAGVYGTNLSTSPFSAAVLGFHQATEGSGVTAVYGYCQSTGTGSTAVRGVNIATEGLTYGVRGQANSTTNTSSAGVYGYCASGRGIYGQSLTGNAGYFQGNVNVTGTLTKGGGSFLQPHKYNPKKEIHYAMFEGPEHAVFLRGTAQLKDGRAVIETPEHFRTVAGEEGILVQLTPRSDKSQGLAAVRVERDKIKVHELFDGKGNYHFDYFITAKRAGFEKFEPVQENKHFTADGMTKEEFEESYNRDDLTMRAMREMLISNGILTKDGRLNMVMVKKLGWKLSEEEHQKLAAEKIGTRK